MALTNNLQMTRVWHEQLAQKNDQIEHLRDLLETARNEKAVAQEQYTTYFENSRFYREKYVFVATCMRTGTHCSDAYVRRGAL